MRIFRSICAVMSILCLPGISRAQDFRLPDESGPFMVILVELDGNEWQAEVQRDTGWRRFTLPLGSFGEGEGFLNTPVTKIVLVPIGGGGLAPPGLNTDVVEWIDHLTLAGSLIDDFDDRDYSDWAVNPATNGSFLVIDPDEATPDGSPACMEVVHGNMWEYDFAGMLEKDVDTILCRPGDTLSFWLRGMRSSLNDAGGEGSPTVPRCFLSQNYPNPFNPETAIRFAVPTARRVHLAVFNALGEDVAVLVDEVRDPGEVTVSFDAGGLPSGVYTCRLTAGTFTDVRKMVLVK